jgi:cation diffusion facilitator CzcD-associated flavoprotein CzcO
LGSARETALESAEAIIVGAGPAGLACAATLGKVGVRATILEREDAVAPTWRRHYDCLHLHTERRFSALPGLPMPRDYPRFPSRQQVVDYLTDYAAKFDLRPRFNCEVRSIRRIEGRWMVESDRAALSSPIVVIAVGLASFPSLPAYPGSAEYRGRVLHSVDYHNPTPYRGMSVLVVGYGNSGAEIALDLARSGVETTISVRSPVLISPRTILGIPVATLGVFQRRVPAGIADLVNVPLIRATTGRIEPLGFRRSAKGPRKLIAEDGRPPIFDIGTLAKIREGGIRVRAGLSRLTPTGAVFVDGAERNFDALIFATGFQPSLRKILPDVGDVFGPNGLPRVSGGETGEPGLFFCGTTVSPSGQLREIALEAKRIASLSTRRLAARA